VRALLDTNVLVDYLNGVEAARTELALHRKPLISLVTWMEILVGARNPVEAERLRAFLSGFQHVPIDDAVSEVAVEIRRQHRIRLPDAIIRASARSREALLVTRNTKDFAPSDPGVRVPYALG